jgi:hypothetical protein
MLEGADERFRIECRLARGSSRSPCSRYGGVGEMFDEVFDYEVLTLSTSVCGPALAL